MIILYNNIKIICKLKTNIEDA